MYIIPMQKKSLLITAGIASIALFFVGWFAFEQTRINETEISQINDAKRIDENLQQKQVVEVTEEDDAKQVQQKEEGAEDIEDENGMVWYGIPEIGIRFKVTPDTKNDLKYTSWNSEQKNGVVLYSSSETDANFSHCILSEDGFTCGRFFLNVSSNDSSTEKEFVRIYKKDRCSYTNGKRIPLKENLFVCLYGKESLSDDEYKKYFGDKFSGEKKFGLFIKTVEIFEPKP